MQAENQAFILCSSVSW